MKVGPIVAALVLVGAVSGAVYWIKQAPSPQAPGQGGFGSGGRRAAQSANATPVAVAPVITKTVPVYRDGIGNVQALNAVTVRSQVDGRLMSVAFTEGMDVKKGDVLAQIDPVTFKALYDQAMAKKAQDEATLGNARMDLERYRSLAKTNAGPKQQADQQAATVAQLEAQLASDQGAIDNAKAVLDYTTIVSPLDGRVGLRQVDPGNIVHASDASGIVSISQLRPIGVLFTLPQRDLAATNAAVAAGKVVVEIPSSDGKSVEASGMLRSIDNQIDVTTGTIKLKAEFPNTDLKLWPGQFVSVRVVVDTLVDAKVVPASAVRRGVAGNFVYTVGEDGMAHVKTVSVPLQNEVFAVLDGDIAVGQKVVTEGFSQLTDGKAVVVSGGDDAAAPVDPAAAPKVRPDGTPAPAPGQRRQRRPDGVSAPATEGSTPPTQTDAQASPKRDRRRRDETAAAPTAPAPPSGATGGVATDTPGAAVAGAPATGRAQAGGARP